MVTRAYKFKLKPNKTQQQQLLQFAGARRFIYNWCVEQDQRCYDETKKGLSAFDLNNRLTELKKQREMEWLKEINSQTLQAVTRDFYTAKKNFFDGRCGKPRFRSRHKDTNRFKVIQHVKFRDRKVRCPSIGWIRVYNKQELDGTIKQACFKQNARGDWFVSIVVEVPDVIKLVDPLENPVGIDLGLNDYITTSDGYKVAAPKIFRWKQRKLAKAQRRLSRRIKGSKRYDRAKLQVAKIHRKIVNIRKDFQHKLSDSLTKKYSLICLEDLNIKALARTKLAKSFYDAGQGEFIRQTKYKSEWRGRNYIQICQWYPSSRLCGICGYKHTGLSLSDREWVCPECGTHHDRDRNAAINILNEGIRLVALGHRETLKTDVEPT